MASSRFRGSAEHSIDSKGRLAIPARMRAARDLRTGDVLVATIHLDACIMVYPLDAWEQRENELSALNQHARDVRQVARLIIGSSIDMELDGQCRVVLAKDHLEYAGLAAGQNALVVGQLDHMEVWNPERYRAHLNAMTGESEELVERVMSRSLDPNA